MDARQAYGPNNPHPLSTRRTELVWEGKYDEYGNRRAVDVAGMAMPLQKIETVDEPRSRAEGQGKLFEAEKAHRDDFRNMLIWGDNKLVMASLLKEFRGKVDLIYIDPPFDVGADFSMNVPVGEGKETAPKDQSVVEMVAYRDMWGRGTDSYLEMLFERLTLIRELMSERATLCVHLGMQVNHFARAILGELFGRDNEITEIVWSYGTPSGGRAAGQKIIKAHEYVLVYAKQYGSHTYNKIHLPYDDKYVNERFTFTDEAGRRYRTRDRAGGLVERQYLDESPGVPLSTVWSDIRQTYAMHLVRRAKEETGFPTQKPERLLERIVSTSSKAGDLVADFFCGSGTTGVVAERLDRRWLMCDLGRYAIHTSRKRLLEVQRELHTAGKPYRSFDVYNLGRYERQWWQQERLKGADDEHRRVVMNFFKAEPLTTSPAPSLHGRKGAAFVHVDAIDTLLTRDELRSVVKDAAAAGATEVICLSWEFEMDLKLVADALEKECGVKARLYLIPREIMERNRTTPPPFFEVATLKAEAFTRNLSGKAVWDIRLTEFLPSLAEVPNKEVEALKERAIQNGFDFIDFWAVDFDFRHGEPFHHDWQAYRTRKDRKLPVESDLGFELNGHKSRTACVKVVDIFGCDTSITVEVPG